jgi:diaminopropionate ammonia-lyase
VNPLRDRSFVPPAVAGDPRAFHRRLPGYAITPLVDLPVIADETNARRVVVKTESARLGLPAFKVLGASWATYRVLADRLGHEPEWREVDELRTALEPLGRLALAAATDGNHGRAVAHVAALLGYDARIFVPAGTSPSRIDGIASEGATVTVVDGDYDHAVTAAAALAGERTLVISDTAWPGYETVPRIVIDGYSTIFGECDEQLAGDTPDVVVVQLGVGALAAAVVTHYAPRNATIVGVEPTTAACHLESARAGHPVTVPGPHRSIMAGLNCGNVSPVAWPTVSRGLDGFVAIEDDAAEQAMRAYAAAGVVAGETGASGLGGLRAAVEAGAVDVTDKHVLLICTEGATDPVAYERIVGRPPSR